MQCNDELINFPQKSDGQIWYSFNFSNKSCIDNKLNLSFFSPVSVCTIIIKYIYLLKKSLIYQSDDLSVKFCSFRGFGNMNMLYRVNIENDSGCDCHMNESESLI